MTCKYCYINDDQQYILEGKSYDCCISCFFKVVFAVEVDIQMIKNAKSQIEQEYFKSNEYNYNHENLLDFIELILSCFYLDCN
jgi:hypothetical protein